MSRLPFSRSRKARHIDATIICPKCLGKGTVKVLMSQPFRMEQESILKKQTCSLCNSKGRVFPTDAAQYLFTQ